MSATPVPKPTPAPAPAPVPVCPSPLPDSPAYLMIPSTNCSFTVSVGIPETAANPPPDTDGANAVVELRIQGWYKLYVEPVSGHPPVTVDAGFFVSPKLSWHFNLPLSLLSPSSFLFCDAYLSRVLDSSPLEPGVAQFLKPHILKYAVELARGSSTTAGGTPTEFKITFDVKVIKIDLADKHECDAIRRRQGKL